MYVARKALPQSRCHIYVNEHLTKSNESLFRECRGLWKNKKIAGTWTCIVYAKLLHDGKIMKIINEHDVEQLQ